MQYGCGNISIYRDAIKPVSELGVQDSSKRMNPVMIRLALIKLNLGQYTRAVCIFK